jgi:hypothetical protein
MASKRKTRRSGGKRVREPAAAYGGPGGEVAIYRAPDGKVALDTLIAALTT